MIKKDLQKYESLLNYNLFQIELDYLQNLILKLLYEKYDTLYFKGGTCLQKCYGIKRFSEDLDFNYKNIDLNKLFSYLKNYFPYEFEIKKHNKTKFGDNFSLQIKGPLHMGSKQSTCKLLFDFRLNDTYKKPNLASITPPYKNIEKYDVLTLDEEEILAEKIRAIITRLKARDVFDLNELLLNKIKIDFKLINKKLSYYDKQFNMEEFEEKLEEKRKIYGVEMKRLTDIYQDFDTCKKRILKDVKKAFKN
ncbi:MAG: nucleotidyl transferase AbiEii/AbiGii toxin family protein [Candidatus Woesearchaeota archaeon]